MGGTPNAAEIAGEEKSQGLGLLAVHGIASDQAEDRILRHASPSVLLQKYLNHGGAYIPECIYFWGDMFAEVYGNEPFATRIDKLQASEWHKYEWVSGPGLVSLLLDRYAYSEDAKFLRETALPAARELLALFDQHYETGEGLGPRRAVDG